MGLLQSVKLSGDQIKPKQEAIVFQQLFYSDLDNSNDTVNQRYKELDVEQFIEYLKETEQNFKTLQECFLERDNPDLEVLMWVSEFLKSQVYNRIFFYPFFHKTLNNLPYEHDFLAMPAALFAPITKRETVLHESMLISGEALTSYFRHYIGVYKQTNNLYRGNLKDDVPQNTLDSLTVYGLLNSTNDDLFKQVVLTTLFSQKISVEFDIEFFERFQSFLEQTLKEPFLRDPLWALYQEEKQKLDAMNKSYGQSFNGEVDELGKQLLDSIISINKGKIIYLDYWATWCGPCRAETPKTKLLMEKMKGENVVVAFFCLHSEMEDWQKAREEIELGGQHYFLPKKQSLDFVKSYGINGVPNYMLIDAQGNIVDQGVHLKPDIVPERINELLQN